MSGAKPKQKQPKSLKYHYVYATVGAYNYKLALHGVKEQLGFESREAAEQSMNNLNLMISNWEHNKTIPKMVNAFVGPDGNYDSIHLRTIDKLYIKDEVIVVLQDHKEAEEKVDKKVA